MALNVLLSEPQNNDISVPIDSSLKLTFSKPIDINSALNGISLYSIGSQSWTGSLLSTKDALTSDVKSDAGQLDIIEFSVSVSGAIATITPSKSLEQKRQYFLQVAPGNDPTRFVSAQTTDTPVYSVGASGTVTVLSSYTGTLTTTYTLIFTSETEFDLMEGGLYKESHTFTPNTPIVINNNLKISISSGFLALDTSTINVYIPEGLSSLCKIVFTTSNYTISAPNSIRIEDKLYNNTLNELKVTNSIPPHLSINNVSMNPIVIKFNRNIDPNQDFTDKVNIHRLDLESGIVKRIVTQTKVTGNLLKIYLVSTEQVADISESQVYQDISEQFVSIAN